MNLIVQLCWQRRMPHTSKRTKVPTIAALIVAGILPLMGCAPQNYTAYPPSTQANRNESVEIAAIFAWDDPVVLANRGTPAPIMVDLAVDPERIFVMEAELQKSSTPERDRHHVIVLKNFNDRICKQEEHNTPIVFGGIPFQGTFQLCAQLIGRSGNNFTLDYQTSMAGPASRNIPMKTHIEFAIEVRQGACFARLLFAEQNYLFAPNRMIPMNRLWEQKCNYISEAVTPTS